MRISFLILIFLLIGIINSQGQDAKIIASAPVTDFAVANNVIFISTTKGTIESYNLGTKKLIKKISFPKIKDFAGDLIDAEVFKIALIGKSIYAVVHGLNGFNDVYRIDGNTKKKIINGNIIKSVVIDIEASKDNHLYLGLLSSELIKYNTTTKKVIYRKQISNYAFSAMTMSKDGKYIFSTDESGEIHKVDLSNGKVIKDYKGQNVDNVLCIDYASGIIVCGGKDRRFSVYNTYLKSAYHISTNSFVIAVGISPSGKIAALFDDENNNIVIYKLGTKSIVKTLKGHTSMVNKIYFTSENQVISCSIDKQIIIWKI